MQPNSRTVFISEVTSVQVPEVIKESKEGKSRKLTFVACLQTCGVVNSNRRIYPTEVMKPVIDAAKQRAQGRSLLGELDHPLDESPNRQVVVSLSQASHLITSLWFSGNEILGKGETLTTPNGAILYSLIKDKVPVGFSLRALGNLEPSKEQDGVFVVSNPLFLVTYDAVSKPSHPEAVIRQVMTESYRVCTNGICTKYDADGYLDFLYHQLLREELGKYGSSSKFESPRFRTKYDRLIL